MKLIAFFSFLLLTPTILFAQQPQPEAGGVSPTLAQWRAAHYSDVRYKLNITLEKGAPLMKSDIEIQVKLTGDGAKNDLILDWITPLSNSGNMSRADIVAVNDNAFGSMSAGSGNPPNYLMDEKHLIVPKRFLKTGKNLIKINFTSKINASGAAVTRYIDSDDGAEYIYARLFPGEASAVFPCFDQPDLKARFSLTIGVPENWKVVSNTDNEYVVNQKIRTTSAFLYSPSALVFNFKETKPINIYVFAFAAGGFEVFAGKESPVAASPLIVGANPATRLPQMSETVQVTGQRIYVRKSQAKKIEDRAMEILRLHRENKPQIRSRLNKLDIVLLPGIANAPMAVEGLKFISEN